jgi:HK97 family phage portal protein
MAIVKKEPRERVTVDAMMRPVVEKSTPSFFQSVAMRATTAWKVLTGQQIYRGRWDGGRLGYGRYSQEGGPWWERWVKGLKGRPDGNSIVMACVQWVGKTFPEAPLRVWERTSEGEEVIPGHDLEYLLENPNPYYAGPLLWMATVADYFLTGNAYWLKVRDRGGGLAELWWIPSGHIEPRWEGNDYISYYEQQLDDEQRIIPQQDIVHMRYGLDPENPRKGKSPLATVISEVLTDDEATLFTMTILRNLGVPGVVISPNDEIYATDEELDAIKERFQDKFLGSGRGEPLVLSRKTQVQVLSFSPQQMALRELRKIPEERVTAVLGLPAIVAGLGAGLDRSTFANFKEAREAAYESLIIPMQRMIAADAQTQLLHEFEPDTRRFRCGFDISNVRVLQEDQNALATRLVALVNGGVMTPAEARTKIGLKVDSNDKVAEWRLVSKNLIPVDPDLPTPSEEREQSLQMQEEQMRLAAAAPAEEGEDEEEEEPAA